MPLWASYGVSFFKKIDRDISRAHCSTIRIEQLALDHIFSLHNPINLTYHKTSNIRRTLVSNKIVDHSDVVGASPVGAAPTTSSFST